jgi:hypothetical protein
MLVLVERLEAREKLGECCCDGCPDVTVDGMIKAKQRRDNSLCLLVKAIRNSYRMSI